jgi:hypothetical protein
MASNSEPIVYAPKEFPRAHPVDTPKQALEVADDVARARSYVDEFYDRAEKVHRDTVMSCRDAAHQFFLHATMPDRNLKPALVYQLIRVALGVLPATAAATRVFEALSKGLSLADDANRLTQIANLVKTTAATVAQRGAAFGYVVYSMPDDSAHAKTSDALDQLSKWATKGTEEIIRQKNDMLGMVDASASTGLLAGNLRAYFSKTLGAWPVYEDTEINKIGRRYEMNLYKEFYGEKGRVYQAEAPTKVEGVPSGVIQRLKQLTLMPTAFSACVTAGFILHIYHCRRDSEPMPMVPRQPNPHPVTYRPEGNWRAGQKW